MEPLPGENKVKSSFVVFGGGGGGGGGGEERGDWSSCFQLLPPSLRCWSPQMTLVFVSITW